MARRVFFSFDYADWARARVVKNSWVALGNSWVTQGREAAGFVRPAHFERMQEQGEAAIRRWIDQELSGTSVTVVLVGANTCRSKWVQYEIERSEGNNGLIGIDVSKIKDRAGRTTARCGQMPKGYPFYFWNRDHGYRNLADWIEQAAQTAGR